MRQALYLAWRYLLYHRLKTAILIGSVTLIVFLPVGLRVLVQQSSEQLSARAAATPLVLGSRGSPLELALNTLYFRAQSPETMDFGEAAMVARSGHALAIPMHVKFRSRKNPIVGTSLEYFAFRGLSLAAGRQMALLGECVVGNRVARTLEVGPGDHVVTSPETVFDLAGVYPLKMPVAGVLEFSDTPDDDAIFVDVRTAWIIAGLGHGHQDLSKPEAATSVLKKEGRNVVGNASVVQYTTITADNIDSFHFHGDLSGFPITAVIAVPPTPKSAAILQGRYEAPDLDVQVVRPDEVMNELLDTILTVETFVVAGAVLVGLATLATVTLVFLLSLRLRRREIETLHKIGGSRLSVAVVMTSEIALVLAAGVLLAAGLTLLTSQFGSAAVRALVRM